MKNKLDQIAGYNCRIAREKAGLSQAEIGRRKVVSQGSVSNLENENWEGSAKISTVQDIADYLKIDPILMFVEGLDMNRDNSDLAAIIQQFTQLSESRKKALAVYASELAETESLQAKLKEYDV